MAVQHAIVKVSGNSGFVDTGLTVQTNDHLVVIPFRPPKPGSQTDGYLDGDGLGNLVVLNSGDLHGYCDCYATHDSGNDWIEGCPCNVGTGHSAYVKLVFPSPVTVKSVRMTVDYKQTRTNPGAGPVDSRITTATGQIIVSEGIPDDYTGTGTLELYAEGAAIPNLPLDELRFGADVRTNGTEEAAGGYVRITRIEVTYIPESVTGQIGTDPYFDIRPVHNKDVSASGTLKLASTYTIIAIIVVTPPDEPDNHGEGMGDGICLINDGAPTSGTPLQLRTGTKLLAETDLAVQTPAGMLAFTRRYNQAQQEDSDYQFMGLGWSHNHRYQLSLSGTSPNRTAVVRLPDGGSLTLDEDSADAGHFDARSGSTATLDYDSGADEYHLTAQDQQVLVFDGSSPYDLLRRVWPSGETWTFSYYSSGFASGLLQAVDDGYGRGLQLTYIDDSGQFDDKQLWRVGDHDASGLDGGSPSGRYVEFSYTTEKDDGSAVASPEALLASVRDVRGQTWTYDYYGQDSGEDDDELLNLLVEIGSPSVDTDGDGSADGSLTLQRLSYSHDTQLAVNGGMEVDDNWRDLGTPTTNEQSTGQVDSGTYSRHVVADAADEGIEGEAWNLVDGRSYTITAKVYPVSGTVKMQVSDDSNFDDKGTVE